MYTIRNCYFEPSLREHRKKTVEDCLKDINNAFLWKKPAIIASHRLNFVSSLDKNNQIENLILLRELLASVIKKWPEVEFMDSSELLEVINPI